MKYKGKFISQIIKQTYNNWWLILLILFSITYALPNIYGEDPALQVSSKDGNEISLQKEEEIKKFLYYNHVKYQDLIKKENQIWIKFNDVHTQMLSHAKITQKYDDYNVALNLLPRTPKWLSKLGANPMRLGLDLRGGVHFLLAVDTDYIKDMHLKSEYNQINKKFKESNLHLDLNLIENHFEIPLNNIRLFPTSIKDSKNIDKNSIPIKDNLNHKLINTNHQKDQIISNVLEELNTYSHSYTWELDNKNKIIIGKLSPELEKLIAEEAIDQVITVINNRVNALGMSEAIVQKQGDKYISVDLPGVQDIARAKSLLGKAATLSFHMANTSALDLEEALKGNIPNSYKLYKDEQGRPLLLEEKEILNGSAIIYASSSIRDGQPVVQIRLGGGKENEFYQYTANNIGRPLAVVYKELQMENINKSENENKDINSFATQEKVTEKHAKDNKKMLQAKIHSGVESRKNSTMESMQDKLNNGGEKPEKGSIGKIETNKNTQIKLTEKVINVATIQSALSSSFEITGLNNKSYADNLALLLRSGSLSAPLNIIEEANIGPSLGLKNIKQGLNSLIIGSGLVFSFMIIYYGLFGLIADLALILNLIIIVAMLSIFDSTLTLPGIAGMVLTVGMAVDANVLINERIREELRNGHSIYLSIQMGYKRALSTIIDSNVTTMLVALILFFLGSGSVKGFALTLIIGLLSSMLTSITFTRSIVNIIYTKNSKNISIGLPKEV